jgi:hypothetical protein
MAIEGGDPVRSNITIKYIIEQINTFNYLCWSIE